MKYAAHQSRVDVPHVPRLGGEFASSRFVSPVTGQVFLMMLYLSLYTPGLIVRKCFVTAGLNFRYRIRLRPFKPGYTASEAKNHRLKAVRETG